MHPIGPTISLVSVWDAVQSYGDEGYHTLTLADTADVYGTQVIGKDGTATGPAFTATGHYDFSLSLDVSAAKLSQAAYDSGAKQSAELRALGWQPLKDAAGRLDAGGGKVADGVPTHHTQNAYAFAASRALPGDVVQFAISFRSPNNPISDLADWLDNNSGRFGSRTTASNFSR